MAIESPALSGKHIRLEPLTHDHVDGLVAAAAADASLYQWSPVPQGKSQATTYVDTALAWRDAGTAVPFAIISVNMMAPSSAPRASGTWSAGRGHKDTPGTAANSQTPARSATHG